MKVLAILVALVLGAYFVDRNFHHGRYFGGAAEMSRQIASSMGLRR